jgi:hypothetical protein
MTVPALESLAMVSLLLAAVACSDSKASVADEGPDAGAPDVPTSFMFVQEANAGTLMPNGDGTYSLALQGVVPSTVYFSDRPQAITGSVPTLEFLTKFDWGSFEGEDSAPPNAAIALQAAPDAAQDTLVVELTAPEYDESNGTLHYTVRPIPTTGYSANTQQFGELIAAADPVIPESFGITSIFIDSCGKCKARCYGPYWISGSQACRSKLGDIGKVSCCWSWRTWSCSPCHDYLEKCKAGPCNCSGSCPDPLHRGWTACGTSEDCMGDPDDGQ